MHCFLFGCSFYFATFKKYRLLIQPFLWVELFHGSILAVQAKQYIIQPEHKYNKHKDPYCQTSEAKGVLRFVCQSLFYCCFDYTVNPGHRVEKY